MSLACAVCVYVSLYSMAVCLHVLTERIACILCMHLGACRFTHLTALMHLKKNHKEMHPAAFYFSYTYANGISLRIIIKDYIITQNLINETALNCSFNLVCNCKPKPQFKALNCGFNWVCNCKPKPQFISVSFSDVF